MSAPPVSLPAELAELMTVTFVEWSQSLATDINGQWAYAAPVQLDCWVEGEGYGSSAGMTDSRATFNQNILQQTRRPEVDLYFNGSDSRVQSFKFTDTFTLTGMPGSSLINLMPTSIETFFPPPYNNLAPWSTVIGF